MYMAIKGISLDIFFRKNRYSQGKNRMYKVTCTTYDGLPILPGPSHIAKRH